MKLLIISAYYEPFNNASSLDIQSKIEFFKQIFSEIDLVTTYEKKSLEKEKKENLNIYRVKNLYKNYNATNNFISNREKVKLKTKLKNRIKTKILEEILIPDPHVFWINAAYKFIKENLDLKEYNYIVTMGQTNSPHLIGLKLKKKFQDLKWISYWNDPWFANLNRYNCLRERIEKYLEKKVVKNCDGFLLFCDEFKEKLIVDYKIQNKNIFEINGFYREFKTKEILENNVIKIVHTGDIYLPIRDILPFIEALNEINLIDKEYKNKVIFSFVGEIKDKPYLEKLKKIENVEVLGKKNYEECKKNIENSDVLLLLGNKGVKRIPSKVFEYISYSKPIITILGEKEEPLLKVFKEISRGPIINNNKEEIKNNFFTIPSKIKDWKKIYIKELENYKEENIKKEFKKWLERLN